MLRHRERHGTVCALVPSRSFREFTHKFLAMVEKQNGRRQQSPLFQYLWPILLTLSVRYLWQDVLDDEIDWWSKYYASTGEIEKAGDYLERGYDKLTVSSVLKVLVITM